MLNEIIKNLKENIKINENYYANSENNEWKLNKEILQTCVPILIDQFVNYLGSQINIFNDIETNDNNDNDNNNNEINTDNKRNFNEMTKWIQIICHRIVEMLHYTCEGGKLSRGTMVLHSLKYLKNFKNQNFTHYDVFNAVVVLYCFHTKKKDILTYTHTHTKTPNACFLVFNCMCIQRFLVCQPFMGVFCGICMDVCSQCVVCVPRLQKHTHTHTHTQTDTLAYTHKKMHKHPFVLFVTFEYCLIFFTLQQKKKITKNKKSKITMKKKNTQNRN